MGGAANPAPPTAEGSRSGTARRTYALGALGGSIRGYELGVVAGALLFAAPALHISTFVKGWVVSSALLGSVAGAMVAGPASDRFGRRRLIALAGALYAIGILGVALAPSTTVLLLGRIVLGLGVGIATAIIPVYVGEMATARGRGAAASLFQLMITVGVLSASIASYVLSFSGAWRWMFAIGVFPALAMMLGSLWLPESPRFLVNRGRVDEARAVLRRTRGAHEAEAELEDIARLSEQARRRLSLRALWASPPLRKLLIVGSVLGVFQQFTGTNSVTYYAPTVLTTIGFSKTGAILANIGISSLGLVSTAVMVFFVVDRFGRRVPLMIGAIGMFVAMGMLGVDFAISPSARGAAGDVALAGLALFQVVFALSWGGIVWTVLGEMFPLRVRGTAMAVATCMTEGASVIVSFFFPDLLAVGTATVFFIFAGMSVLAFLWVTLMLPETGNRSLEALEAALVLEAPSAATEPSSRRRPASPSR